MLHMLPLHNCSILEQLHLEEALIRTDNRNWCIVNVGTPPAIVMGISGKPEQLVNGARFLENPLPIIRRFSGGGTVVVDHNTIFVTLILNKEELDTPPFPQKIMEWTEQLYKPAFGPRFQLRGSDYTIDNRKFGGNAQYLQKERILHHSTLLWDYDPKTMALLTVPPRSPEYRNNRNHKEFLCSLKESHESPEQLVNGITSALKRRFDVTTVTKETVSTIPKRPHRKATTLVDWIPTTVCL